MSAATRRRPPAWLVRGTQPLATLLAGRRWFPLWGVVHHRGRRSGTTYATPIAVIPTRLHSVVLIGLPWGPGTNWVRNVLAADGAPLWWKGRLHRCTNPRVVDPAEAVRLARGGPIGRLVGSGRFPAFLVLDDPTR